MSRSFTLQDPPALGDLQVLLARAARIEEGSVRVVAGGGVLAAYVAVLYPVGLMDESPTVLGLRAVRVAPEDEFDVVVPLASLRGRLERTQLEVAAAAEPGATRVELPSETPSVTWAAISPPRGGWQAVGTVDPAELDRVARDGIAEVAAAVPASAGEQIVRKVRAEVWGREVADAAHLPAGAAFAALSLGFLGANGVDGAAPVETFESGSWARLSSPRGHVLVKRRGWTLSR